jgi:hypothetical protein
MYLRYKGDRVLTPWVYKFNSKKKKKGRGCEQKKYNNDLNDGGLCGRTLPVV